MTYKLIYLARRAPTVSREDWPRTWKSHAVFASRFPELEAGFDWMRYCNRVDNPSLRGLSEGHDGVAVAAGESLEEMKGAGLSAADRTLIEQDELRVFDMPTSNFTYYCSEDVIHDGPLGEAVVFSFFTRKPEMSHAEFEERWNGQNAEIARKAFASLDRPVRYVHNRVLHDPLPLFPFDGIAESWFTSPEDALLTFQDARLNPLRQDLGEFTDIPTGVAMITNVCHRYGRA